MAAPCRGRIVWVDLTDPQGGNVKCRPAIILTPTDEISEEAPIVVAAISTQIDAFPAEVAVELPWHRDRHPKTGLNEPCIVVCNWLRTIKLEDVRAYAGVAPGKQLIEILSKVKDLEV